MAFPSNPQAGQTYTTGNGTTYTYTSDGVWKGAGAEEQAGGGGGGTTPPAGGGEYLTGETWTDGKPVYRWIAEGTNLNNLGTLPGPSGVDSVIKMDALYAYGLMQTSNEFTSGFSSDSAYSYVTFRKAQAHFRLYANGSAFDSVRVIMDYTKA